MKCRTCSKEIIVYKQHIGMNGHGRSKHMTVSDDAVFHINAWFCNGCMEEMGL